MTGPENPLTAPEDQPGDDASTELLFAEVIGSTVFPEDDLDWELAEAALTDDDREAMNDLGSSEELVERITSCRDGAPDPEERRSTQMVKSATASTRITARPSLPETAAAFNELLQRVDSMDVEYLSWSCEYRKKKVIGRGGQGVVFLTESVDEHDLPKALKVFSPRPYGDVESYSEDMARMGHVASLVYQIQVDNLVIIERFAYQNDLCVMIMRWIDGHDLATLLQPKLLDRLHHCVDEERWKHLTKVVVTTPGTVQPGLMPGMAMNIVEKCLRGLDALHSQGIVHADIKPSNIMLDKYGSIRLVDIGSAFEVSSPPRVHTWTPLYAPPEIFKGKPWTVQSDLASLGYVLIELLCGRPAVTWPEIGSASTRLVSSEWDRALLDEKLELPHRLRDLLPDGVQASDELMDIIRRLIDPNPEKRFPSSEVALEVVHEFLQGLTRVGLAAHFSQEIKHWLADVEQAMPFDG